MKQNVSGNCMYAPIVHGVVNIIGGIPVFLSLQQARGLLGPNPSGLIGMTGLLLCAAFLFSNWEGGKICCKWMCKRTCNIVEVCYRNHKKERLKASLQI